MFFFDAFLDTYYLHSFQDSEIKKREYTTQANQIEKPRVNLVHAGLNFKENNLRGRLALQTGDSVEANTINEINPFHGHIQESYFGMKLGNDTWIDGGIYLGHIGMESWISKHNITYTRSMLLDYVPYYSTGIRISRDVNNSTHLEFHIMNGWQNISETNSAKSVGFQYKKNFGEFKFTYNNFFGDEKITPKYKNRFRTYHNFIAEFEFNEIYKGQASFDFGTQGQQNNNGIDFWTAQSCALQFKIKKKNYMTLRLEYYSDPNEANVITNTKHGFRVISSSINYDFHLSNEVLWRTEVKKSRSKDKIYPVSFNKFSSVDHFVVTSLSISI